MLSPTPCLLASYWAKPALWEISLALGKRARYGPEEKGASDNAERMGESVPVPGLILLSQYPK